MKINIKYLIAFVSILLIEILIALFVNDRIIRPYIGDVLIIILMYTFIKALLKEIKQLPIYLFGFAIFVEIMQFFNIVGILGLQNNKVLSIIIGGTFDIKDILCYLVGSIILIIWDRRYSYRKNRMS